MARRYCYKDVLPCAAMVAVECFDVVMSVLFKAASSEGLSYYTFLTYSFALATLVLLPLTFFLISKTGLPPFKFPLISRLCLLGLSGFSGKLFVYKGLELGSPTLSSAISNLTPAFTFVLSLIFSFHPRCLTVTRPLSEGYLRTGSTSHKDKTKIKWMTIWQPFNTCLPSLYADAITRIEKAALRSSSTRAKIIGTIASMSGASVIVLYKGPKVLYSPHWTSSSALLLQQPLESPQSNWVIGGLLLALGYLCYSFWFIIQAQVMKIYPEEMIVTFIYNLSLVILLVPVSLLAEPNLSSWRLTPRIVAASVLYSGIFALALGTGLHTWGVLLKGPVYVASFKPLSIVIAAVTSAIFLGDELYLGSVIGALILSAGLYAVLWGKAKEEEMSCDVSGTSGSGPFCSCKVSLLQSHGDEPM